MRNLLGVPAIVAMAMMVTCLHASAQTEDESFSEAADNVPAETSQAVPLAVESEDITEATTANVLEDARDSAATAAEAEDEEMAAIDAVSNSLSEYLVKQGAPEDGGAVVKENGSSVRFATGQASASVPKGSANFSQARSIAFERAFQSALGAMALMERNSVATKVRSVLDENSAGAETFAEACKPDATQQAIMKGKQLASALVNKALKDLEVPEDQISQEAPEFKCENPKVKDAFEQTIVNKALASMAGVRVVKSVAVDGEVGVVVASSPKFHDAARSIARGEMSRNPLSTAAQEIVANFSTVDADKGTLLGEFGVRCVKLSNGETAVYAYGQSAADVRPREPGAIRSAKIRAAKGAARSVAAAQLAQFAKVTTAFTERQTLSSEASDTVITVNGNADIKTTEQAARMISQEIKSTAAVDLVGAQTVKTWRYLDPDSQDYVVGAVIAWSPSLAATMDNASRPSSQSGRGASSRPGNGSSKSESVELEEDW